MKTLAAVLGILFTTNAFAGGLGTQGVDDIYLYLAIMGCLALFLGINYFNNFIQRIIRDPEYRQRLKESYHTLISTLREGLKPTKDLSATTQMLSEGQVGTI